MAGLSFDGTKLKDGAKVIANVYKDKIYEGSGRSKCLANIYKDKIYQGSGRSKCMANVYKGKIYDGSGHSTKIAEVDDAKSVIDGPGSSIIAALWFICVR
jgi:hypothetical protein